MTGRAGEMLARLEREWREAGLAPRDHERLARRATEVMRRRSAGIADEHHPVFLHPLRTVLLLLEAGEVDPRAHAAALLLDSECDEFAGGAGGGPPESDTAMDAAMDAATAVFDATDAERLERLIVTEPWVRRTWLAERLDHLRHLHLWAGAERTFGAIARAEREEAPLAAREGGRLQRAWADWMDKAHRFRLAERADERPIDT